MDEYSVTRYLHAADIIRELEKAMQQLSVTNLGINLATHVEFDETGAHVVSPKIQRLVEDECRQYDTIAARRDRWLIRRRLFGAYLASLPTVDRLAVQHYPNCDEHLKQQTQAELYEIETYTAFRCGFEPPEEHIELPADPVDSVAAMAAFLGGD